MKLWGGRFEADQDIDLLKLNNSLNVDKRMYNQDLRINMVWSSALEKAGILSEEETNIIQKGLETISSELGDGSFIYLQTDEDIHTAIERRLIEIIGPIGGKIHTGRSRNDQVVTDFRLWLLDHLPDLEGSIINLQQVLINQAERDFPIIMPGYTHFQPAQPILLSHWWMSHFWPLNRDRQRLGDLKKRTSVLPLGSSALSGNPFNIDQEFLTELLGFRVPAQNSLDAVSDRDFAVEFLFIASLIMVHLSKLSESLILFTNPSLAFFELPDAYATGSSIMPQKKNPDLFELTRGKCGTIIGNLTGLLATLKGLPSAYDKDLQEDKSPVFTTFDVIVLTLKVLSKAIAEIIPIKENIEVALKTELFATDIADYMVRLGIPFREAHTLTGKLVQSSIHTGLSLDHMPLDKFKEVSPLIKNDVFEVFNLQRSVSNRQSIGGTAPQSVKRQISNAKEELSIIYT